MKTQRDILKETKINLLKSKECNFRKRRLGEMKIKLFRIGLTKKMKGGKYA